MKYVLLITAVLTLSFGVQAHHRHYDNHGHYNHGHHNHGHHNHGYDHRYKHGRRYRKHRQETFLGIQLGDLRIGIGGTSRPRYEQFRYSHDTRRHYHGNVVCYKIHNEYIYYNQKQYSRW